MAAAFLLFPGMLFSVSIIHVQKDYYLRIVWMLLVRLNFVVVVYYKTIVAIGHGLKRKFWLMVIGCILRIAGSSIIGNFKDPLPSIELLNYTSPWP